MRAACAAPTGVASEAEYVEIGVVQECDPQAVREALARVLPPGLDVVDVVEARTKDFVERLEASHWLIELPGVLQAPIAELLAADEVIVERMTKSGVRAFDARAAVLHLEQNAHQIGGGKESGQPCAILSLTVRHGTPTVRPDDVLAALSKVADFTPPVPPRITRLAQGPLQDDGWSVGDPLAADRLP